MKKTAYIAPVVKSEAIQVGVFGAYGGKKGHHHHSPLVLWNGRRLRYCR